MNNMLPNSYGTTQTPALLNRNQLKYLVIIAMLIDHIAWAFVPTDTLLSQLMHFIGRLTGPTMAYFVAEGYYYTRDVRKYALRLGIFALISWMPYVFFEHGTFPIAIQNGSLQIYPEFGVMYTLLLGLGAIRLWDSDYSTPLRVSGVVGMCLLSVFGDWPVFDVLWCLVFYIYRNHPKQKWTAFCIVGAFVCVPILWVGWIQLFQLGIFLVPLLIQYGYNGKSGSKKSFHKWFFYIFYPAHLLILGILKYL